MVNFAFQRVNTALLCMCGWLVQRLPRGRTPFRVYCLLALATLPSWTADLFLCVRVLALLSLDRHCTVTAGPTWPSSDGGRLSTPRTSPEQRATFKLRWGLCLPFWESPRAPPSPWLQPSRCPRPPSRYGSQTTNPGSCLHCTRPTTPSISSSSRGNWRRGHGTSHGVVCSQSGHDANGMNVGKVQRSGCGTHRTAMRCGLGARQ